MLTAVRRQAGDFLVRGGFEALSRLGRLHPKARFDRHQVEVLRDIPYRGGGASEHHLDVYRRTDRDGPQPVVLYIHGGGFRILSKETHWLMGLAFARRGFVVFNINYRLAPRHPFPAAIEDACAACEWVLENAAKYGGDRSRLVFAGESAGANLVTALAIADAYERPEPYARAIFEAAPRPQAVLPACGILQVSDWERFHRRKPLRRFVRDRIEEVSTCYLPAADVPLNERALADPLVWLEHGPAPDRPLPPFFAICGTRDPLLDDTRRLQRALNRHGAECETRVYPGGVHAFHAFVWTDLARRAWRDQFAFLDHRVPA